MPLQMSPLPLHCASPDVPPPPSLCLSRYPPPSPPLHCASRCPPFTVPKIPPLLQALHLSRCPPPPPPPPFSSGTVPLKMQGFIQRGGWNSPPPPPPPPPTHTQKSEFLIINGNSEQNSSFFCFKMFRTSKFTAGVHWSLHWDLSKNIQTFEYNSRSSSWKSFS